MTPQQAAELTVARARLKANHITLDQCYRSRRRIQAQRAWARIKGLLVLAFLVWLLITFARTAQAQSTTRSFYDGRGSFAGSSVRHGKWTNFYDRQGRYSGTVIDTGPR